MDISKRVDLNWNHLFYFSVIGRHKSFKRAALELNLSSSTLSEAIQSLEKNLNCRLLVRTTRSLDLTTKGVALYNKVKNIFEQQSGIFQSVDLEGAELPSISLGIVPSNTLPQLMNVVFDVIEFQGASKFFVKNTDPEKLETLLGRGDLDIGLTDQMIQNKNVGCQKIYDCETHFFVHRDLKDLSFAELLENMRIGLLGTSGVNQDIKNHFQKNFPQHNIKYIVSEYLTILIDACLLKKAIIALSASEDVSWNDQLVKKDCPSLHSLHFQDEIFLVWSKRIEGTDFHRFLLNILSKRHLDEPKFVQPISAFA